MCSRARKARPPLPSSPPGLPFFGLTCSGGTCSWPHAFSQKVRQELYEAYAFFVSAFRLAADKLKAGDRTASFPTGSFPPHLPFVRALTAESLASG